MTDDTAGADDSSDARKEREHSASDNAALSTSTTSTTTTPSATSPPPPLKLRNYRPKDRSIAYVALPRPSYAADSAWLDAELSSLVESAVAHDNADVLLSIAPQSINWDLKRDLAPKLALLKKQTAKALQELRRHSNLAHTHTHTHRAGLSCLSCPLSLTILGLCCGGVRAQRRGRLSRRATTTSATMAPDRRRTDTLSSSGCIGCERCSVYCSTGTQRLRLWPLPLLASPAPPPARRRCRPPRPPRPLTDARS